MRQIDALLNQNTVGRIQIEEAKMGILTVKTSRLSFHSSVALKRKLVAAIYNLHL